MASSRDLEEMQSLTGKGTKEGMRKSLVAAGTLSNVGIAESLAEEGIHVLVSALVTALFSYCPFFFLLQRR